jgi:hypothetical protein
MLQQQAKWALHLQCGVVQPSPRHGQEALHAPSPEARDDLRTPPQLRGGGSKLL